jgi:hypothetical protein
LLHLVQEIKLRVSDNKNQNVFKVELISWKISLRSSFFRVDMKMKGRLLSGLLLGLSLRLPFDILMLG